MRKGIVEIYIGSDRIKKIPVLFKIEPSEEDAILCKPIDGSKEFLTHYKSLVEVNGKKVTLR